MNFDEMFLTCDDYHPEISYVDYQYVLEKGFPTGSRVIGGFTDNSDYDYVMLEKDYLNHTFTTQPYVPYNDLFGTSSVKVSYASNIINILVAQEQVQLDAWKFATKTYLEIYKKAECTKENNDKELRVKLFSALRELYLTTR